MTLHPQLLATTERIRARSLASRTAYLAAIGLSHNMFDAAMAMTSRENRDSSMPGWPCVTPSHIAGTPPATCAVPPAARAAARIRLGYGSSGWCADSMSL